MNDLGIHLALFALVSSVIVLLGSFYAEALDGPAFRGIARRLAVFFLGCAVLVGVMLLCEHTLAAV